MMHMRLGRVSLIITMIVLFAASPAGASKESKAANLYLKYYNEYMYTAFDKGIHEQNSSNPAMETAGINAEISAINRFDNHIQNIKFPSSDRNAVNKVLAVDAVLTALDGTLALNTNDVTNYNSLFNGVVAAQANSTVAIDSLAKKLGMNWS